MRGRLSRFGQLRPNGAQLTAADGDPALLALRHHPHRPLAVLAKTELAEQRLLFVVTALRRIFTDEHFRTLLRAEGIADVPKPLADRITGEVRA